MHCALCIITIFNSVLLFSICKTGIQCFVFSLFTDRFTYQCIYDTKRNERSLRRDFQLEEDHQEGYESNSKMK